MICEPFNRHYYLPGATENFLIVVDQQLVDHPPDVELILQFYIVVSCDVLDDLLSRIATTAADDTLLVPVLAVAEVSSFPRAFVTVRK